MNDKTIGYTYKSVKNTSVNWSEEELIFFSSDPLLVRMNAMLKMAIDLLQYTDFDDPYILIDSYCHNFVSQELKEIRSN